VKEPVNFTEDIFIRGMIHALTIRSPVARGILSSIKCPKLPHSYHLITAAHIPGKNELAGFPVPVLADKNLVYAGQPVAILTGPDKSKLDDLASGIEMIIDEEAPVFSGGLYGPGEAIVKRSVNSGMSGEAPEKTDKIVFATYSTGGQAHWYAEPHGAVAIPVSPFTVYTATQWPYHVKCSVERVLGLGKGLVKINPAFLTPHLDGKIWYPSLVACHAALAAWISKSPVKLMLTGEEDFLNTPKRNRAEIGISSTLGATGEILSSTIHLNLDLGAQGIFEDEIIDHTCLGSLGFYRCRTFRIAGIGIRTNIPPQGPMAGFGLSQGSFACERHVSHIADTLGQDPAEWRKNNFLKKNESLAIGTSLRDSIHLPELIEAAAAMSDYHRKWASYELLRNSRRGKNWEFMGKFAGGPARGIGITTACQSNGFINNYKTGNGDCTVELTLAKDENLEIKTSVIPFETSPGARSKESGRGRMVPEAWQNLIKETLGIEIKSIQLTDNTLDAPDAGIGTLSRNISVVTKLIELCCQAIRKQRMRHPLPITVTRSAKPSKAPSWAAGKSIDGNAFAHPSWGAAVVEIEIDPVSISPVTRGIWLVVDGGKILSQRRARSTLRTGIIQALGWTCREQIYYRDGKIPNEFYRGYDIPAPIEIPPINVDFVWNDKADPKGIGELPFCCIPAAYVQAVSQAIDHHFQKIPLDSREIMDVLKLKKQGSIP